MNINIQKVFPNLINEMILLNLFNHCHCKILLINTFYFTFLLYFLLIITTFTVLIIGWKCFPMIKQ